MDRVYFWRQWDAGHFESLCAIGLEAGRGDKCQVSHLCMAPITGILHRIRSTEYGDTKGAEQMDHFTFLARRPTADTNSCNLGNGG